MRARKLMGTVVEVHWITCKDENHCHKECNHCWPSVGYNNCALFRVRLASDPKGSIRCAPCKERAALAVMSRR